jgi:hypothetical protein
MPRLSQPFTPVRFQRLARAAIPSLSVSGSMIGSDTPPRLWYLEPA